MDVTITTNAKDATEMMVIKKALQKLAKNATKENLIFLAGLSELPGVNEKIQSKKKTIVWSLS